MLDALKSGCRVGESGSVRNVAWQGITVSHPDLSAATISVTQSTHCVVLGCGVCGGWLVAGVRLG
jgi:hypothetical protein